MEGPEHNGVHFSQGLGLVGAVRDEGKHSFVSSMCLGRPGLPSLGISVGGWLPGWGMVPYSGGLPGLGAGGELPEGWHTPKSMDEPTQFHQE